MTTTMESRLRSHLGCRAGDYYPELRDGDVSVRLRGSERRISSALYEYDLASRHCRHTVLVKCPRRGGRGHGAPDRPRLCSVPPLEQKSELEFHSLTMIERHLAHLPSDRFGSVRMLDLLPDGSALVMEKVPCENLLQRLWRSSRFSCRQEDRNRLGQCLQNAGSWLRSFHQLPPLVHTHPRNQRREEIVELGSHFMNYVFDGGRHGFGQHLMDVLPRAMQQSLPENLPLGLNHGDYAPRNILTENCGRIRVIDTLARWEAPIYEDLAKFLFAIKFSSPQVWSQGHAYSRAELAWFEELFLKGYFGDEPVPTARIRLFECLTILERWVALVHASREAGSWKRWVKDARRLVWEQFARHQLGETVQGIEQHLT